MAIDKIAQLCLAVGFIAAILIHPGYADSGPQYRGSQVEAMGGSGTASITGTSSLFLNPAGLAGLQGYSVEAGGNIGLNGTLFDYSNWAQENSGILTQYGYDSLLAHSGPIQNRWAPLATSYYLQGHYQDFAFSVVRDVQYAMTLSKAVLTDVVGVGMLSDLQVAVGRGFQVAPDWNVGVTAKYLDRQSLDNTLYGPNDDQFYTIKNTWQSSSNSLWEGYKKISVATEFTPHAYGFGFNFGVDHPLPLGFAVGASLLDLPTFFGGGFLDPQLNLGGSYIHDFPGFPGLDAVHYHLVTNLDWQAPVVRDHDVVSDGNVNFPVATVPWFDQWKAGVSLEGKVGNREVGTLSMGLNDGYPTFGVRAGYILYAYYVYTAEEEGDYPGQLASYYHKIGLDMNF